MALLAVAFGAAVFVAPASGSPLLTNGDFESGDFAAWTAFVTTNGTTQTPAVTQFDTTGAGASLAAQFDVGQVIFEGPGSTPRGGGIHQKVILSPGSYEVSADIAAFGGTAFGNIAGGLFELMVNGVTVDSHDFGQITGGATERSQLNATVMFASFGFQEFRLRMSRPFISGSAFATPNQYVDNIVVAALPPPPVGGVVEMVVASGDSPVADRSGQVHEREAAALAIALAAVAGVSWHRFRRRTG